MSAAKREQQEAARRLRAQGLSLAAIARRLEVAKSSVSVWVRDVPLSAEQRAALAVHKRRTPASLRAPRPELGASGRRRRCSGCREDLPIEAFNRSGDDHQWYCRACFKAYFRARGEVHRNQMAATNRERRFAARAYVLAYLETHPCADCGCSDPVVLEFDHVRDKVRDIAQFVHEGTFPRLLDELEKCEVVCVNCHRRRTAQRGGHAVLSGEPPARWSRRRRAAQLVVWNVLRTSGCVDCGETDLVKLDFDHRRDKRASPHRLVYDDAPMEDVLAEMAKCDVRCANCHRRRTSETHGHYRSSVLGSSDASVA